MEVNKKELNKKLLEFAGFEEADIKKHYYWQTSDEKVALRIEPYEGRDAGYHVKPPNFTESLDACFKWLVPKVSRLYIYRPAKGAPITVRVNGKYREEAETPALALCLAIEKLIDSAQ